ncbi:NYN domain-containing protein [Lacrimispora sp. JR3]|uniref:NYN domain-containing protein n=1 Tax=Lacrimispora sinapis TaxID=3111456 RepID=UPI003748ACB1
MKSLTIGILAHVDAGKTTLSESILYQSGKIGKPGRVDKKNTYLDTYELERERGITIFSKQAVFPLGDMTVTLLDTPGHVDFGAEMERTLRVLDYAILVINGADGVQGHTHTLWRLLSLYRIPAFLFINKMDQEGTDKPSLLYELKKQLSDGCVDFSGENTACFYEELAMCGEDLMETYLEQGEIKEGLIRTAVKERKVFPCYFGSALKNQGIDSFLAGIKDYVCLPQYPKEWGARVFKVTRDEQGNRLTHLKVTGGTLSVRTTLSGGTWEEKVHQIRIYSGTKYESVKTAEAGTVCAVTGLSESRPGEGMGFETARQEPVLEPVLFYRIQLPEGYDSKQMLPKFRLLEEENPELHVVWNEELQEIQVQIMGEVQMEILTSIIKSRFGVDISFDEGRIVYKETIKNTVEGVGHFEPLRHYAEVHLLLEPGEPGSGLVFSNNCSEDVLAKNWQRLVLTHLEEKVHRGVLTGSAITDMKITLVSGRANQKHTEGGDFREATYRAVRQGLKQAESVLLEPWYSFTLRLPESMVGRAMMDMERMGGTCELSHFDGEMAELTGSAPVAAVRNYQKEVAAYSKGLGRLVLTLKGYEPCHNADEIIAAIGYDSERDTDNPTGSVFCAHGTGYLVPWDQVRDHMHVESFLKGQDAGDEGTAPNKSVRKEEPLMSLEEIQRIIEGTYSANRGRKSAAAKSRSAAEVDPVYYRRSAVPRESREEYLLVDGYNIIFAWPELKELAEHNLDSARLALMDQLSNYQGIRGGKIIAVFDAYRLKEHPEEVIVYHNIQVVYTKEAQTADQYIEKFAQANSSNYHITVATSDGLQQIIVRGAGCGLLSARDLKEEMEAAGKKQLEDFEGKQPGSRNYLMDSLSEEAKEAFKSIRPKKEPEK